jgi:hypothetical protein
MVDGGQLCVVSGGRHNGFTGLLAEVDIASRALKCTAVLLNK